MLREFLTKIIEMRHATTSDLDCDITVASYKEAGEESSRTLGSEELLDVCYPIWSNPRNIANIYMGKDHFWTALNK